MKITINNPLCYQEVGRKDNQEDTLYPEPGMATDQNRIFMLCDGMGGHDHGEVASQCVAETVGKVADACNAQTIADMRQALEKGLAKAYEKLDGLDTNLESTRKMGTTLTFLGFCEDGALVGHIGDSRVYQLRPGKGIIFQTRDHSLVNDLLAAKEITPEEARTFKQKNVITRAVLPHREYPAKATCKEITDIQTGDIFFMCCDGVIEQIDNNELEQILLGEGSTEARLDKLRQTCKERNTKDNNSCYLIEVKESDQVVVPVVEVSEAADDDDRTMTIVPVAKKKSKWLLWVLLLAIAAGIAAFMLLHITDNSILKIGGNDIPPTDNITTTTECKTTDVAPVVKEKPQPVAEENPKQEEQVSAEEQKEPAKQNSLLKFKEKEETPTPSSEPQKDETDSPKV
ncbi:MAG: protein phosphatase 2C domain-containing protein [Bacteroidaceae bacterium]|nr:protein phosphatase 2C domain-containing protein [Bacteroidaceae bacterium]